MSTTATSAIHASAAMQLLAQPILRSAFRSIRPSSTTSIAQRSLQTQSGPTAWTCTQCRKRLSGQPWSSSPRKAIISRATQRQISTFRAFRDEPASPLKAPLPSQTEQQRWQFSKRTTHLVDNILARASIASQHINAYTGTDYTAIETLRRDIQTQETTVRAQQTSATAAKAAHHDAVAAQAGAQREIVGLLERKSSWTPGDLERYMALVRSEHVNEVAVQRAREELVSAEKELEEARAKLERLERMQYHEEQIWSDTIRRNSTWVTFGLMGVNILLLLAQIAVFEPRRRKMIVRDVKAALDEKTLGVDAVMAVESGRNLDMQNDSPLFKLHRGEEGIAEKDFVGLLDSLSESERTMLSEVAARTYETGADPTLPAESAAGQVAVLDGSRSLFGDEMATGLKYGDSWHARAETLKSGFLDLFSDRLVQIRKLDLTATALGSVVAGAVTVSLIVLLPSARWNGRIGVNLDDIHH